MKSISALYKRRMLSWSCVNGKLKSSILLYVLVSAALLIAFTINMDAAYKHSPGAQKIASESLLNGELSILPEEYKHGMVVQRNIFVLSKVIFPSMEYEQLRKVWMYVLIFISSLLISVISLKYYGEVGFVCAAVPTVLYVSLEGFSSLFFSNLYWLGFLPALSLVILFYANTSKKIFWLSFFAALIWFLRGYEYATWYGLLLMTPFVYQLARKELSFLEFLHHCLIAFFGFFLAFVVVLSVHAIVLYMEVDNFSAYIHHMISKRVVGLEGSEIRCFNVSVSSDMRKWILKDEGLYFGRLIHYLVAILLLFLIYYRVRMKLQQDVRRLLLALISCGLWGLIAAVSWYFAAFYHNSCHHHLNDILYLFPSGLFFTAAYALVIQSYFHKSERKYSH